MVVCKSVYGFSPVVGLQRYLPPMDLCEVQPNEELERLFVVKEHHCFADADKWYCKQKGCLVHPGYPGVLCPKPTVGQVDAMLYHVGHSTADLSQALGDITALQPRQGLFRKS